MNYEVFDRNQIRKTMINAQKYEVLINRMKKTKTNVKKTEIKNHS